MLSCFDSMCEKNDKKPVIAGIIAEYNPLHNGHVYHIQKTRELLNPDYIICVMSGNYTQRGEPAFLRKQVRVECALRSGIDCVIELPFIYATASAEFFAGGGVSILHALGCVTHISFGCESPDLTLLQKVANILAQEPKEYGDILKEYLDCGYGFAAAREKALHEILPDLPENLISGSNNILAVEYLKRLNILDSPIKPLPIQRKGASYGDTNLYESFSSAMAIRRKISEEFKITEEVASSIPKCTLDHLTREIQEGRCPLDLDRLYDFFQIFLRRESSLHLSRYPFMEPGLENRLKKALDRSSDLSNLIQAMVTKRYPATRIKRLLLNILAGITLYDFERFTEGSVPYVRILGFNREKPEIISLIGKSSTVPVVTKASDIAALVEDGKALFEIEARTTDIYHYLYPKKQTTRITEYEHQMIKV
jgi:predicted nucleotidyltransferase